jgi:hypothetical protein
MEQIDVPGIHLRLVALDVDHDVAREPLDRLGHAIRPAPVLRRGHHRLAAGLPHRVRDARVVGGHDDPFRAPREPGLPQDVDHERQSGLAEQGLAGQPGGAVARGDDEERHGGRIGPPGKGAT